MILGRGELDGTWILTGDTVAAMTRDRRTPAQHADPPFNPPLGQTMWEERGFGYCFDGDFESIRGIGERMSENGQRLRRTW